MLTTMGGRRMQVTRVWVDEFLLPGQPDEVCLSIGGPITRQTLRGLVADRQLALAASGAGPGKAVALQLPPSVAFIANLLAWTGQLDQESLA